MRQDKDFFIEKNHFELPQEILVRKKMLCNRVLNILFHSLAAPSPGWQTSGSRQIGHKHKGERGVIR